MNKKLLGLAILLLAAGTAQAQQKFPNTYQGVATVTGYDSTHGTIDPATGTTPGTVTITVTFTGKTTVNNMNQSGIMHHPYASLTIKNATQTYTGPGFLPNNDMNGWSHSFSFDLMNSGCDFQILELGNCEVENQPQIQCPIYGLFAIPWQKIRFEIANTTSTLNRNTRYWNGSTWVYNPTNFCNNQPDFPGPNIVFDNETLSHAGGTIGSLNANFIRTQDLGYQLAAWGTSFTGLPFVWFNLPRAIVGGTAIPYLEMGIDYGMNTCTDAATNQFPPF